MLRTTDLDDLSLRRLAAGLGVTAPALYAHVEDKGDLLAAVAEEGFAELVEAFGEVEATDPLERMYRYGRAYIDKALHDPEVFRVMFVFRPAGVELAGIDNELDAATAAFERPLEAIAAALETGAIHPARDVGLTALTLWTAAHGTATVLLLGAQGGRLLLPDYAEQLIDDVLRVTIAGLAQPPAGPPRA